MHIRTILTAALFGSLVLATAANANPSPVLPDGVRPATGGYVCDVDLWSIFACRRR